MLRHLTFVLLLASACLAQSSPKPAPWALQTSNTNASLRGIHAVGDGTIAWASGSDATVLRTTNGGATWTKCSIPRGAEKLDFRGLWAWDADTALVMSSGPGSASRIYKTKDACRSWKLEYTNLEEKGFWDTVLFATDQQGFVLGDPVDGNFRIYTTRDQGETWFLEDDEGLAADPATEGAFAASNSALATHAGEFWFGSGGKGGAHVSRSYPKCPPGMHTSAVCPLAWEKLAVPLAGSSSGAGVFSLDSRQLITLKANLAIVVAVGGDYEKPAETAGTAAYSTDGGKTWTASAVPPHGYRSAVQWNKVHRVWIAAGTNGSDYSPDDGKTWQPLDDGTWNALSLPYIVGPKGRIARLADAAIPAK